MTNKVKLISILFVAVFLISTFFLLREKYIRLGRQQAEAEYKEALALAKSHLAETVAKLERTEQEKEKVRVIYKEKIVEQSQEVYSAASIQEYVINDVSTIAPLYVFLFNSFPNNNQLPDSTTPKRYNNTYRGTKTSTVIKKAIEWKAAFYVCKSKLNGAINWVHNIRQTYNQQEGKQK